MGIYRGWYYSSTPGQTRCQRLSRAVSRALGMVRLDGFPLRHRDDPWLRQLARSYQLSYLAAEVSTPPVA